MPNVTLTVDATQAARVTAALGAYWSLVDGNGDRRDATLAEVKAYLVQALKSFVRQQEAAAAQAALTDLTVT